jgi:hypothetical protein
MFYKLNRANKSANFSRSDIEEGNPSQQDQSQSASEYNKKTLVSFSSKAFSKKRLTSNKG